MRFHTIIAVLLFTFGASSALAQDDIPPSELSNTVWVLTQLNSEATAYEATLTYNSGNFTGTTGCNSYIVPVAFSGEMVAVSMGPITLMACPEPGQNEQESAFLIALQNTVRYMLADDVLTLFDADDNVLMAFEPELTPLMRADWALVSIEGEPVLADTTITANFRAAGVGGSSGCNNYAAVYTLNGNELTFSMPVATMRACQPESL